MDKYEYLVNGERTFVPANNRADADFTIEYQYGGENIEYGKPILENSPHIKFVKVWKKGEQYWL